MRTPITYYGGKQMMVPNIVPIINNEPHEVYTETFFGGGAIFFAKNPSSIETINDLSGNVVNFYEQLKLNYKKLKPLIESTLASRVQWRRATDIYKAPEKHSKLDRAWAFWFCTNFSFAAKPTGGLRYSNYMWFSIPNLVISKKREFTDYLVKRIENTLIENKDALQVLKSRNIPKALHYIDPPYPESDQGHYSGYSIENYTELLDQCACIKGKFILSSYHYPVLDKYCKKNDWFQLDFDKPLYANTAINSNNRKATVRKKEVITMNFRPGIIQKQLDFSTAINQPV